MAFYKAFFLSFIGLTAAAAAEQAVGWREEGVATTGHRRGLAEWRVDLPWIDLTSKLSPSAALVDTSPADYLDQCTAELEKPLYERTMHAMIDQPSGLCLDHLFCAFEGCYPNPDQSNTTLSERLSETLPTTTIGQFVTGEEVFYSTLDQKIKGWVDDMDNAVYNLPSKVLFPVVASDVVAAVNFAKDHGLELSVKNSGHNYVGASTKKDTLHLNMNRYTQYAPTGVSDCDASTVDQDLLSGQPCRLSLAKGKSAVIRVGGGENWDKTYRAVQKANKDQADGYKYHVVGGAAATVSPMGWTFQGGLSGTTGGRIFGFGADQVLQVEMALPNGQHVKFGPTEWELVEGYDVPKTTSVSGVCRTNQEELDEDKWVWGECPNDINFDDLWFAVRGGGGGTWGVVLSLHLQLHEYLPLERLQMVPYPSNSDLEILDPSLRQVLDHAYQAFEIKFLFDPESINVTEDQANACGWAASDSNFSCYGEGSAQVFDATWRGYLSTISKSLVDSGIPLSVIEAAVNCTDCSEINYYEDYASSRTFPEGHPYAGKATDDQVYIPSSTESVANIIIPKKWVLENIDKAAELFPPNPTSYRAFGGRNMKATSDQANALSQAHRDGAYMFFFEFIDITGGLLPVVDDSFFTDLFPEMYDTTDGFPGFIGSNHAGPNTRGPLKEDWSKACPLEWTEEERDEKCISLQEAIYGTKVLKRLEAIKEAVDPNYMFDCNGCIGNNRMKKQSDEPSGTSSLYGSLFVVSACVVWLTILQEWL